MFKMKKFFLILTMLCNSGIKAATVTSSLDDGNPGTLRSVLASASGGGEIIDFNIPAPGIILLDESLGILVVDKELIIDGGNEVTIDGQNQLNIGFHITNSGSDDASNSIIQNITIQNFNGHDVDPGSGTAPGELSAIGILIDSGVTGCSVVNTIIKNIHSGVGQIAIGVLSSEGITRINDNRIEHISSEDNPAGNTVPTVGILIVKTVTESCNNNTITLLSSGDASGMSGDVFGMNIDMINCDCSNNTIYNLSSGTAGDTTVISNDKGAVYGISVSSTFTGNCFNNTIYNLSSGTAIDTSGNVFGINFDNQFIGNCFNNTIYNLSSGIASYISGSVFAIRFITLQGDCYNNKINNLVSGDASFQTGTIFGITLTIMIGNCSNNTISRLFSGTTENGSLLVNDITGGIFGISFTGGVSGNCNNNTISLLRSGNASTDSGSTSGILFVETIEGDCSLNILSDFVSGVADNNSGDTAGITLNNMLVGDCSTNNIYNFSSGTANNNSGDIVGVIANQTVTGSISGNHISRINGGPAQNNSGFVYGIVAKTITQNCSNNMILYLTSGQAGNNSQSVVAIQIEDLLGGNCLSNNIQYITSGAAGNTSGIVGGIFGFGTYEGNLSNNTIQYLTTGNAGNNDQHAMGVFINRINGNSLNNLVTDVSITNAINIDRAGGIRFSFVGDNGLIAYNTIRRVSGGQNSLNFGIEIEDGNNLTIRNNTIDSVANINGPAHGLILGSMSDEDKVVSNSLASFNTISNITGNSTNGFGITILGPTNQSTGNDLLSNSIFNINGKAINILDNGVPVDAIITLQSALCGSNKIIIRGTIQPEPGFNDSEFLLQFFTSKNNIPPQTMTFLGEQTISAIGSESETNIPFLVEIKGCFSQTKGQFITATATAQLTGSTENNNTSEVSNTVPGCNTNSVCAFVCTQTTKQSLCPIRREEK